MPLGIPQYIQCILHALTSILLCVTFTLLKAKDVDLAVARDGFPSKWKLSVFFIVAILTAEVLFEQLLIRAAVKRVEHS